MELITITDAKSLIQLESQIEKAHKDLIFYKELYKDEYESLKSQVHRCKDGTTIMIQDMSDTHLENTISLIAKNHGFFSDKCKKYTDEMKKRGNIDRIKALYEVSESDEDIFSF